jgi:hypothetical protein
LDKTKLLWIHAPKRRRRLEEIIASTLLGQFEVKEGGIITSSLLRRVNASLLCCIIAAIIEIQSLGCTKDVFQL